MPLDYKILNKKPIITRNGVKFQDLAVQTIDPNVEISGSFLVVNKYYVARPDLISLAVYGDDKYADILCKINGISNPFELNENDVIILPHVETLMDLTNMEPVESIFVDGNKNNELVTGFMDTELQRDINSSRSPNEQTKGMSNIVVDDENGIILY